MPQAISYSDNKDVTVMIVYNYGYKNSTIQEVLRCCVMRNGDDAVD